MSSDLRTGLSVLAPSATHSVASAHTLRAEVAPIIRALGDTDVDQVVAACRSWQELAMYGPPYWRPRSSAELRRKVASTAGPELVTDYSFVVAKDDELVGECSLHNIDWRNRNGQIGVCVWQPDKRHRGYGTVAVRYIVDWAFGYCGLQRLEAWIVDGNEPSLKLFDRVGFVREGTLRRRYLCAGKRYDMHVLALRADEWLTTK